MNNNFRTILLALVALTLAVPAVAQKVPPVAAAPLKPSSKWTVEHADWQCVLHRELSGNGQRALFSLALEPLTSVAWLKVALSGSQKQRDSGDAVMFGDGQRREGTLHYNVYRAGGYEVREFMLDLDKHAVGTIAERVRFWTKRHGDLEVQLSGFQPAWGALKTCMRELYKNFGIVEADVARMTREPKGDIFSFVRYPRPREGGSLEFVLLYWIAADGRVDDCRLLRPSGNESFDRSLCSELKAKARFQPATNAAGEPVRVPRFENIRLRTATMTTNVPSATPKN